MDNKNVELFAVTMEETSEGTVPLRLIPLVLKNGEEYTYDENDSIDLSAIFLDYFITYMSLSIMKADKENELTMKEVDDCLSELAHIKDSLKHLIKVVDAPVKVLEHIKERLQKK